MEPRLPEGVGATAIAIAAAREAESGRTDRLFEDPLAGAFRQAAGWAPLAPGGVLGDYVAVRTRYFDDFLLGAGCRQVVILAAGLDARAFRLGWPPGTRVFELDLPASLAFKERVLAGAVPRCDRHVVAVDLREDWGQALQAQGFDPQQPTAWLAEGLMSYLEVVERERLVVRIGALSAPGSWLALESAGALMLRSEDPGPELEAFVQAYRGLWRSTLPADPGAWLAGHGWQTAPDAPADVWARHGRQAPESVQQPGAWFARATRPAP